MPYDPLVTRAIWIFFRAQVATRPHQTFCSQATSIRRPRPQFPPPQAWSQAWPTNQCEKWMRCKSPALAHTFSRNGALCRNKHHKAAESSTLRIQDTTLLLFHWVSWSTSPALAAHQARWYAKDPSKWESGQLSSNLSTKNWLLHVFFLEDIFNMISKHLSKNTCGF